jgi:hypothetical protein
MLYLFFVMILSLLPLQQEVVSNPRIIHTSFATDNDTIYVYNSTDLAAFKDGTWIFDARSDSSAQLIIQFKHTGTTTTAELFTDQNGDKKVSYVVEEGQVTVIENVSPALRTKSLSPVTVMVTGDWYLPDGSLNWNLEIKTDGASVYQHPFHRIELLETIKRVWTGFFELDGYPDTVWEFHDSDNDGIPEYGIWRLLANVPESAGAAKTWIWANERHMAAQPLENPVFWMYLFSRGTVQSRLNYFDTPVFFEIDWDTGVLSPPIFRGYPIESGFHVHTLRKFAKEAVNYANFENMQAYYDLADDQDGYPELHIRHRYFQAHDFLGGNLAMPVNEIRWSWNQTNTGQGWHYKLGLAGRYSLEETVQFPDFEFYGVPYNQLPDWVTNRTWDQATFIAVENRTYLSTEGIYEWGAVEALLKDEKDNLALSRYLSGDIVADPRRAFQELTVGLRGEFAPELFSQPYLYFSPIDRKLHLKNSEYCLWQIDAEQSIRCTTGKKHRLICITPSRISF